MGFRGGRPKGPLARVPRSLNAMKCIIAGSRHLKDIRLVYAAMRACPFTLDIDEVVSGKAQGIDTLGEKWAKAHGLPVTGFPAGWRGSDGFLDPTAGMRRNERMAAYSDALVAVWDMQSTGTKHMIDCAQRHGLQVFIWPTAY